MRASTRADRLRMPLSRFTAFMAPCTCMPLLHSGGWWWGLWWWCLAGGEGGTGPDGKDAAAASALVCLESVALKNPTSGASACELASA
eukprot:scaffold21577_cov14-Tisochrysis_lutea.AAC.1